MLLCPAARQVCLHCSGLGGTIQIAHVRPWTAFSPRKAPAAPEATLEQPNMAQEAIEELGEFRKTLLCPLW